MYLPSKVFISERGSQCLMLWLQWRSGCWPAWCSSSSPWWSTPSSSRRGCRTTDSWRRSRRMQTMWKLLMGWAELFTDESLMCEEKQVWIITSTINFTSKTSKFESDYTSLPTLCQPSLQWDDSNLFYHCNFQRQNSPESFMLQVENVDKETQVRRYQIINACHQLCVYLLPNFQA